MQLKSVVTIRRTKQYGDTTLGNLKVEGTAKSWFILEPGGPDSTLEGSDKRIPEGTYLAKSYFSLKHKSVYELQNVSGRTFILIHSGNYHDDTEGCLMPGKSWGQHGNGNYYVGNSKAALKEIFSLIDNSNKVEIKIINSFGSK